MSQGATITADRPKERLEYAELWAKDEELAVLGCALEGPREASRILPRIAEALPMGPEAFSPAGRAIYEALLSLLGDAEKEVNLVAFTGALRDAGQVEVVGGLGVVQDMLSRAQPSALAQNLAEIRRFWQRRNAQSVAFELNQATTALGTGEDEMIREAQEGLTRLQQVDHRGGLRPLDGHVRAAMDELQEIYDRRGQMLKGLATGHPDIDRMLLGMEPGQLFIVAARPSQGKSALLMTWASNMALGVSYPDFQQPAVPVAFFSLEMTSAEVAKRLIMAKARVNLSKMRSGFMEEQDMTDISAASNAVGSARIYCDDTPSLALSDLRARLTLARERWGIRIAFVDYLQLMRCYTGHSKQSRQLEVAEISAGLKKLAKELEIPIVTAAQLNRKSEDRADKVPQLGDLRESGSIEQDADAVFLIHPPDPAEEDDEYRVALPGAVRPKFINEERIVNLAKQRNGPTSDDLKLIFIRQLARFESLPGKRALYDTNTNRETPR